MAGGKLSPRGRMISMMYLVLIALLALNVSKEVLDAFVVINQGLAETTRQFGEKNANTYAEFEKAAAENPEKAGPWKIKAYQVKDKEEEYFEHLPSVAVLTNMTQMQSRVRNAEADIIGYLLLEIEAGSLKFNKVN